MLALVRFIMWTGYAVSIPFFAIYCHVVLGISMTLVGGILFVSGLIGAFGRLFGGTLSDRLGRKVIMATALAVRALTIAGFSYLVLQPAPSWPMLVILFIVSNFFFLTFEPAFNAMIADLADRRMRVMGYSMMRISAKLGWAFGALIGGITAAFSFAAMFFATACLTLIALLVLVLFVSESHRGTSTEVKAGVPSFECLRAPGFLVRLC
jgi:predicted MFS family arabinose efflux permease